MTWKLHHMMQFLVFFIDEFIIYVIIQHSKFLSMCFSLEIWNFVRSYDVQSVLTIYDSTYFQWSYIRFRLWQPWIAESSHSDWVSLNFASAFPFSLKCVRHAQIAFQRKRKMTFVACSLASFNMVSSRMWAGLQWCHAPNIVNRHIIWLISNFV